ncbi:serine recombinase [Clostridia bacterium]|nr:serine recombinase [Clostridia bacterium]GHV36699.1 serine recombinase [Clostridia bacterium]
MNTAVKVTVFPATIDKATRNVLNSSVKRRVAAYARVSTNHLEQETSFEAQVDYYTNFINANDAWELVELYSDEAISATSTTKRDGFKRMISDALDGKIDLIITKSVSRFARNTVDSLVTIRQLKENGIECYFEKENIWTFDGKGELLLTIMSSIAQEESRSISENTTWGARKRMADGKVSMPYGQFLGYTKGEDGTPKIVEREAKTVRLIYKLYLGGKSMVQIAKQLTRANIPTPSGREIWSTATIRSILTNEKYAGNSLLQKRFTTDFLTKKTKRNEGEYPQYYVENSHPAIVSLETYDLVQDEMRRNSAVGCTRSAAHCFSTKVFCGECGGVFGSKTWHSTDKYKRTIWRCNRKYEFKGSVACKTPHLDDKTLRQTFITAFNQILADKDSYIEECRLAANALIGTDNLDLESEKLITERGEIYDKIKSLIDENAQVAIDQSVYNQLRDTLTEQYGEINQKLSDIADEKQSRIARRERVNMFLEDLRKRDGLLTEFDESLCLATLDRITVNSERDIVVKFRDGTEVNVEERL